MRNLLIASILLAALAPATATHVTSGVADERAVAVLPEGNATVYVVGHPVHRGQAGSLVMRWDSALPHSTTRLQANFTAPGSITFPPYALVSANVTGRNMTTAQVTFAVAENATETVSILARLTVYVNGTAATTRDVTLTVATSVPGGDSPNYLLLAAVTVLLVAGGAGVYALTRKRQVKAEPRSSALRQQQMEKELAKAKEPEQAAQIQAEMRREEEERALSREAQIVEAKIKDVRAGLDRLRERFEAGQLTQHQYAQMRSKREQQLEELETELSRLVQQG